MTKKKMIEQIQATEASLYLKMSQYEKWFGEESNLHKSARTGWTEVYELMRSLDIKPNYKLPDNIEAIEIRSELEQERIAVEQFEQEDFDKRDIGL